MQDRFKFHVQHASTPYRKGTGYIDIIGDEVARLELPVQTTAGVEKAPKIRNVIPCVNQHATSQPRQLPAFEIDLSRLPIFIASILMIILMLPETIPLSWLFKGIGGIGCFYHILVVRLTRILIEFEDNRYVCGEVNGRVCKHIIRND